MKIRLELHSRSAWHAGKVMYPKFYKDWNESWTFLYLGSTNLRFCWNILVLRMFIHIFVGKTTTKLEFLYIIKSWLNCQWRQSRLEHKNSFYSTWGKDVFKTCMGFKNIFNLRYITLGSGFTAARLPYYSTCYTSIWFYSEPKRFFMAMHLW